MKLRFEPSNGGTLAGQGEWEGANVPKPQKNAKPENNLIDGP